MRRLRGFTIVELLIVVVVIGILTSVTIIGYQRSQASSRDTQRQAKAIVIANALEKYYDVNGEYPSCGEVTSPTATQTGGALQGVDAGALVAPESTTSSLICNYLTSPSSGAPYTCNNLSSVGFIDSFAYVGDCSSTCIGTATTGSCLGFKLEYIDETTGAVDTILSKHNTASSTSGTIANFAATPDAINGFSVIDLTWNPISNATGYTVQYSTDNFVNSNNTLTPPPTTTSATVSSLSQNTTYEFRVEATFGDNSTSGWSTTSATTWSFPAPTLSAGTTGPNSISFSWNSVMHASSYTYTVATDSGFTHIVTSSTQTTSTPATVSGLSVGTTYYVKVDATALSGSVDSGPSNVISMTTVVPTPTGLTATANSSTSISANWNPVSVATSYTLQYDNNSAFSSPATVTGLSSPTYTTSIGEGTITYFRVYALVGSVSSTASSSASVVTPIDKPSKPNVGASRPGAVRSSSAGSWFPGTVFGSGAGNYYYVVSSMSGVSCPSGTSTHYNWSGSYSAKPSGSAPQSYSWGDAGTTTVYEAQPTSGYSFTYTGDYYCTTANYTSPVSSTDTGTATDP